MVSEKAAKWFKEAGFGMMIHWGLYSVIGGEWKGQRTDQIGEWAQSYFRIPNREYHALAEAFNPIAFDAEAWVKLAKAAGMKYLVMTSKHHEGFAMYKTAVNDFSICERTPFKRDVIAELAEQCYKHDLKFGLYYSQELDWSEKHGGGYEYPSLNVGNMSWTNDWDFPDKSEKNYSICFENKIKPQVEELMTKYGDIVLIWFDTPFVISDKQSKELYDLVKHYQPDCLINSRIGNHMGDYESAGDNEIPDEDKGIRLFETPATLNDTWGYKSYDNNWKSAEAVFGIKKHLNERGINYLLNVGPDHLGRMPAPAEAILRELGKML